MKTSVTLVIIQFLLITSLSSQDEFCGFDRFLEQKASQDSQISDPVKITNDLIQPLQGEHIRNRSVITIPVVVHVVWKDSIDNISTERILDQIKVLNEVFTNSHSDLEQVPEEFKSVIGNPSIQFCLVSKDLNGLPTNGIIRTQTTIDKIGATDNLFFTELGGSTAWNTERYFNIWITGAFGNTGYAIPPWLADFSNDGIVLRSRVVDVGNEENREGNGRVAVHEIGHYFGLYHMWGNDQRLDTACLVDDGLSDTPPQFRATHDCPDEIHSAPFSCGNNNMYVNFMDYSPDQCLSMFTQQQVDIMINALESYRPGLMNNQTPCHNFDPGNNGITFNMYPNPTNSRVTFSFGDHLSLFSTIEVYNLQGIKVWTQEDLLYDGFEMTLPDLPQGIYLIKIGSEIQKLSIL